MYNHEVPGILNEQCAFVAGKHPSKALCDNWLASCIKHLAHLPEAEKRGGVHGCRQPAHLPRAEKRNGVQRRRRHEKCRHLQWDEKSDGVDGRRQHAHVSWAEKHGHRGMRNYTRIDKAFNRPRTKCVVTHGIEMSNASRAKPLLNSPRVFLFFRGTWSVSSTAANGPGAAAIFALFFFWGGP